ncbi:MAG TPA: hypothetical protein VEX18_04165 [Polyangiaceae bacterium]|nr:hypothetical protein [Polyangiaceae bacterium]
MTDQIELPTVPQSPPIVTLADYGEDSPTVIYFNRDENTELIVDLNVRHEDRTATLKLRWRIESNSRPPGTQPNIPEYTCPEPEIFADGDTMRDAQLKIQADRFARTTCNRVDVIVSGAFKTCRPDRDDGWDITTQDDDDTAIGRLSFWVWAVEAGADPTLQPEAALAVTRSCRLLNYQAPSATATATSATPGM